MSTTQGNILNGNHHTLFILLFLLPTDQNVDMMVGAGAALLYHEVEIACWTMEHKIERSWGPDDPDPPCSLGGTFL